MKLDPEERVLTEPAPKVVAVVRVRRPKRRRPF
jgi:hypothetical protein